MKLVSNVLPILYLRHASEKLGMPYSQRKMSSCAEGYLHEVVALVEILQALVRGSHG